MAAYASLVSLMQIIDQLEHHPSPPISMDKKQVEALTETVMFLQVFLEGYKSPYAGSEEADPLEMCVADAVHAAEDVIESHIVDRIRPALLFSESLVKVTEHMDLFTKEVMEIVALKGKLRISDSYERMMKLVEHMDCVKKEVLKIVAVKYRADSDSYESLIEDTDLIKNEVMEIVANLCRRRVLAYVSSSASAYLHECLKLLREYVGLIKKEFMEIVALKDQLQMQASSTSADLYDGMENVIEDMLALRRQVSAEASSAGSSTLRNDSLASRLSRPSSATLVGFDGVVRQLMEWLVDGKRACQVIPIVGMGGIGKTTLARNVYAKPFIRHHFDVCAWVTISQQYNTKELLCEILSQANKEGMDRLSKMNEDEIGLALFKCLSNRRYLIVLDDMWSVKPWEEMQRYFRDGGNGSRIMVTTRLSNLGSRLNSDYGLEMKFMDKESSWDLFCKIVFEGKSSPAELVKIGTKIVESCGGLPLSIVVIGGLLEKSERTEACWESICKNINSDNDKHYLKILRLSYNHLPVRLKPCFLYMGMFEEVHRIRVSTIIKLWVSEGFLKPVRGKSLETVGKEYLDELVDRNLILVDEIGKTGNMKYLKMHDLLRDLCLREAEKERFYHVVGQHSPQGMCSQRRVVIPRITSEEEVVDVTTSTTHARSYIRDHERVQPLPSLKLLRILKAAHDTIHRYSVENMLNLRLLDDCDGNRRLPSSIDFLWSLQTLIGFHWQDPSNAPVKIWNMSQLRHVCFCASTVVHGRGALHLPDPPSDSIVVMENLQTSKE